MTSSREWTLAARLYRKLEQRRVKRCVTQRGVSLVVLAVMFAPSARAADPVVQWDDAEQHVGEQAIVEGRVLGVHCSPDLVPAGVRPHLQPLHRRRAGEGLQHLPARRRWTRRYVRPAGPRHGHDRGSSTASPRSRSSEPDDLKLVETKQDRQDESAKRAPTPRMQILRSPRRRARPRREPDRAARRAAGAACRR